MSTKSIIIIQGSQYGSEAKGMVASALGHQLEVDYAVRTGAINAGHTVYYKDAAGEYHICKMQQLPVGWTNPNTILVLGAGGYIHIDTLEREVALVTKLTGRDIRERLLIDERCAIHSQQAEVHAKYADRHHSIGATGKGCAEAIIEKIKDRGANNGPIMFREFAESARYKLVDTVEFLTNAYKLDRQILLEGTQGTMLDLHQGQWPYTTSRMTTAANWVAEAGLSPALSYKVVHVTRTQPIRVAGPSGPLPNEISWSDLYRRINNRLHGMGRAHRISESALNAFDQAWDDAKLNLNLVDHRNRSALAELPVVAMRILMDRSHTAYKEVCQFFEMTTVTKKLRRLADIDYPSLRRSVMLDQPAYTVLTFFNYWYPELNNAVSFHWSDEYQQAIHEFEDRSGTTVAYVTTGPRDSNLIKA